MQTDTSNNDIVTTTQTRPWPDPDRPGNHFLSIYLCGDIDISGGNIDLRSNNNAVNENQ
uniref:Uncharacterized protein n=1 Tax=viral metagenome TaxID=1070528 RepID=A0A6C0I5L8_9ZZZZ